MFTTSKFTLANSQVYSAVNLFPYPQVESKTGLNNWLHCRKCQFQYCHLCRQPCFGLWHFSEYGCKRLSNVTEDLKYFKDLRKEKLAGHS